MLSVHITLFISAVHHVYVWFSFQLKSSVENTE